MAKATTTVQMDERGRVVIPQPVRDKLGINGTKTTVEITVKYND